LEQTTQSQNVVTSQSIRSRSWPWFEEKCPKLLVFYYSQV